MDNPENIHGVSKRQWKKWTVSGRNIFNDLMGASVDNQNLFHHPKATHLEWKHWYTVAWNHAWLAADFISMREKGKVKL